MTGPCKIPPCAFRTRVGQTVATTLHSLRAEAVIALAAGNTGAGMDFNAIANALEAAHRIRNPPWLINTSARAPSANPGALPLRDGKSAGAAFVDHL